jgi:hypothetical protein
MTTTNIRTSTIRRGEYWESLLLADTADSDSSSSSSEEDDDEED